MEAGPELRGACNFELQTEGGFSTFTGLDFVHSQGFHLTRTAFVSLLCQCPTPINGNIDVRQLTALPSASLEAGRSSRHMNKEREQPTYVSDVTSEKVSETSSEFLAVVLSMDHAPCLSAFWLQGRKNYDSITLMHARENQPKPEAQTGHI